MLRSGRRPIVGTVGICFELMKPPPPLDDSAGQYERDDRIGNDAQAQDGAGAAEKDESSSSSSSSPSVVRSVISRHV